jgi:hypothetical protein
MNKTAIVQNTKANDGQSDQTGINWQYVLQGTLAVLAFLAMLAFWGTFAYSMITENVKLALFFGQIIAVMVCVAVTVGIFQKLRQHITKS